MRVRQKHWGIFLLLAVLLLSLYLPAGLAEGGQVRGMVWMEKTVDGVIGSGEGGQSGVLVTLEKQTDSGKAQEAGSAVTDKTGDFLFASLEPGVYRLRVEAGSGVRFTQHGLDSAVLPALGGTSYTPWFSLEEGKMLQKNAGLTKTYCSVNVVAFEDVNANGGRMQTEPLVRGVQTEVIYEYEGETYTVAADITDRQGQVLIRDLSPGTYRLRVVLPEHYVAGPIGQKINTFYNCIWPNEDNTGISEPFTMAAKDSAGLGVGMVRTGSLEGKIWFDANYNGKWDKDEAGLTDAVITLDSMMLGLKRTTQADERGVYSFQGLQPGDYRLEFALPEGMIFTYPGASLLSETASKAGVNVSVQVDVTTSVGSVGAMPAAGMSLLLYEDANLNGVRDDGELPLTGASVSAAQGGKTVEKAVSDENGLAVFNALRGGETTLNVQLPEGWLFSSDAEGLFDISGAQAQAQTVVTLDGTQPDAAYSAAVTAAASVSGVLFEDADNSGLFKPDSRLLSGYTVQAVNEDGVLAEAVTDENGAYTLSPLLSGDYTVRFLLDDTYVASPYAAEKAERANHIMSQTPEYGETEAVSLAPGQALTGMDGSVFRAGVVDGYVYLDEAYVPANTGMRGVTATLLAEDGQDVPDFSYGITDETGAFFIKGVLPGTYRVVYTLPDNGRLTDPDTQEKHWLSEPFTIESGSQIHLPALHGMFTSSIAGTIVHDDEKNPDFSALISLHGHHVSQAYEIRTEADGVYSFQNLLPDTYTMTVTLPQGLVFGPLEGSLIPAASSSRASCEITLAMGEDLTNADIFAAVPVSVFGVIYYDNNMSGLQDEDEYGAEERAMSLWENGQVIQSFVTDDSGSFFFGNLIPGVYELHIAMDENEQIQDQEEAVQAGDEWVLPMNLTQNTPLVLPVVRFGSVSGEIWSLDGTVNGVGEIPVSLLDEKGEVIATTRTDSEGAFYFGRLMPGEYSLSAELPQNYMFARAQDTTNRDSYIQSQPDGALTSASFSVAMGDDISGIDIGMGTLGAIGDRAWLDVNGNGMQDMDEPSMPGIEIALYQYGELIASTTTDVYGRYKLENLYPGEYEMRVTMHAELKATVHQTEFPLVGSILPESKDVTVSVEGVTVPSGGANLHCDLGFQLRKKGVYPDAMKDIPTKDWRPYSER